MEIIQQPAELNFIGNLPDLILSDTVAVNLKFYKGEELLLQETYQPDSDEKIKVDLKELIEGLLIIEIPDFSDEEFHQTQGYADFSVIINEDDENPIEFRVVKGGVGTDEAVDTPLFLDSNFLTWQPQQKYVQYHDPEWLTYYAQGAYLLKAKGYHLTGDETITLATFTANQLTTVNMNYGRLIDLFADQPLYIDVWVEEEGDRLSFIQRLILSTEEFQFNDLFVAENSLGGIDTIRFTGELQDNNDFEFRSALFDLETRDYYSNPNPDFEKNTGTFRSTRERIWSLEFFKSLQKYYLHEGILKRIRVTKNSLSSVTGLLNNYTFNFTWAKQNKYLNLSRADTLPEDLELVSGEQVTILPPRLNEFPLFADYNLLFPVQQSYAAIWRRMSLNDLLTLLGVAMATEGGVTTFLSGSFKVYNNSESYDFVGSDTIITDIRLKGKDDYPVYSTQFGLEFRAADLEYDPINGSVKILNFELSDGEHITISPGGLLEVPDSGLSYPELVARIEKLEAIAAPFIPQPGGNGGGGMVLWKRPAIDIPTGWVEVVDWRKRLPIGWDPGDLDFATVGEAGGSSEVTLTMKNMVPHQHDLTTVNDVEETNLGNLAESGGTIDITTGRLKTASAGGEDGVAKPFSVLNPYRIVVFIEYKPE